MAMPAFGLKGSANVLMTSAAVQSMKFSASVPALASSDSMTPLIGLMLLVLVIRPGGLLGKEE